MNHFKLTVTLIILWTEKWLFLHENLRTKIFVVAQILKKNVCNEGTTIINHPPFSPELTS